MAIARFRCLPSGKVRTVILLRGDERQSSVLGMDVRRCTHYELGMVMAAPIP